MKTQGGKPPGIDDLRHSPLIGALLVKDTETCDEKGCDWTQNTPWGEAHGCDNRYIRTARITPAITGERINLTEDE